LAILCLAAPAVAATPGSHTAKTPVASHVSLFDQLVSWLASLGLGPAPADRHRTVPNAKSTGLPAAVDMSTTSTDVSRGIDPNGHG
jgi:hypothetical protein